MNSIINNCDSDRPVSSQVSRKILVVEDEPSIADALVYALATEAFVVERTDTGSNALELLKKQNFAAVILDLGLPDMSGLDVLRELRKTFTLPVIILTARGDETDRVVGLELGADDYVVKPFSPREIVARVRAILRRASTAPAEKTASTDDEHILHIGPFTVSDNRYKISFQGKELDLVRYEFRLLRALLERPGWIFNREQLMERCWESPEMSLDRTVDTHIKTLRAKIREIDPADESIVTHRGIGYSVRV